VDATKKKIDDEKWHTANLSTDFAIGGNIPSIPAMKYPNPSLAGQPKLDESMIMELLRRICHFSNSGQKKSLGLGVRSDLPGAPVGTE